MSSPLVLVTGASGFLGAHLVDTLLKDGCRVRGTVRSAKVDFVKESFAKEGNKVEIIGIDDISRDNFSHALKGVTAVIHAAAPMPGQASSPEDALHFAVEGTLNVLRQAEKAGVKNFVGVSSINAVTRHGPTQHTEGPVTPDDWNESITPDDVLKPGASPLEVYVAEKILSEKALWDFAEKHPHMEIATVNPPFFLGPMAPGWRVEKPRMTAFTSNYVVYHLLHRDAPLEDAPLIVDVRDVARACVLALKAAPTSEVGRKRFLLSGGGLPYKEAVEYIAQERPQLASRLNVAAKSAKPALPDVNDTSFARKVLKLEFTPWKKTLRDTVDSLVELEKDWVGKGWDPTKEFAEY